MSRSLAVNMSEFVVDEAASFVRNLLLLKGSFAKVDGKIGWWEEGTRDLSCCVSKH